MTTLTAGQSADVSIPAGDSWSVSKTAINEGKFSAVTAAGVVKDAGVFGNTALTDKVYGPYFNDAGVPVATTLTIACTIGSISYTEIPASSGGLTLTTTGTSGPATLSSGVLNIPQYASGLTPVNKTANYTALTGDTGSLFNNSGAAGAVIISLPAATAGLTYAGYVGAAQTLELLANGTNTINNGIDTSSAGGNVQANTLGNFIWLICNTTGKWSTVSMVGDWTLT